MQRIKNIEAEQSVLGSILLEGDFIKETSLQLDQFSDVRHRMIFQAMQKVASSSELAVDFVTVTTELGDAIDEVGGVQYLADLASSIPTTTNFHGYERLVIDAYKLRVSRRSALHYAEHPTDKNMNQLYQSIGSLQELGVQNTRTTKDILVSIVDDMNTPKEGMSGIDTGLANLNIMTGGLQNGDLIIVAARPSMGKTAFALNLALANGKTGGVTDVFSLEMSDKQLVSRMISGIGGINGAKWRNPYKLLSSDDHRRSAYAMGKLEKMSLNIHDQPGQSIFDIRAAVRKSKNKNQGTSHLVVIDYLQLIQIIGKFDRHDLAIGNITRELKNMAREFNIPVVLLSQLSRAVEQRQDKRPMLSDLRDSGSIEQDADIVMFIYRDDYYNRESEHGNITEINVAKHRNGEVGTVKAFFKKEYGKFTNLEEGRSTRCK